jgi:hypothetical protein
VPQPAHILPGPQKYRIPQSSTVSSYYPSSTPGPDRLLTTIPKQHFRTEPADRAGQVRFRAKGCRVEQLGVAIFSFFVWIAMSGRATAKRRSRVQFPPRYASAKAAPPRLDKSLSPISHQLTDSRFGHVGRSIGSSREGSRATDAEARQCAKQTANGARRKQVSRNTAKNPLAETRVTIGVGEP